MSQPLARTGKIVVINSGGDGHAGTGAARVTRDVTEAMAQIPAVIEALTGLNLMDMLKSLPAIRAAMPAPTERQAEPATPVLPPAGGAAG